MAAAKNAMAKTREEIAARAGRKTTGGRNLAFSERALHRFDVALEHYRCRLTSEATRVAHYEDVNLVSERHVHIAVDRLIRRRDRCRSSILTTAGGTLLGLGLSIATQLFRGQLTVLETVIALTAIAIGAAFVTAAWILESTRQ
jgi:hypothetical protein